jgi:phosphoribosyl-dephospho-CoA transferase
VALEDVYEVVTPEALADAAAPRRDLPAMQALVELRPLLGGSGLRWGPTGSVGFELATGEPTATPDSDLDLLVRMCGGVGALPALTRLRHELGSLTARVDCQVETRSGAVALVELVDGQAEVMLRTSDGPRLVTLGAMP